MQYKKKTKSQKFISNLRKQGNKRVCKLLQENPNMTSYDARRQVTKEIRDKYDVKGFRL